MAEIVFDESTHTYTVDGVVRSSVTDWCGIYGDEPDEFVEDSMERAADRGVTMHYVLRLALSGEDYDGEYPGAYQPWADSIERFLLKYEIVPVAIEQPIYSELLDVCGTPDLLCLLRKRSEPDADFQLSLLDWKFVSAINKPKVRAQLLGYAAIFNDLGVFPERLLAVQFTKDGPREYPVDFGGDEWETALKVREIKTRKYKRGRIGT